LLRIYDGDGQEYSPFELLVPNNSSSSANASPSTPPNVQVCTSGIFILHFEDVQNNTGLGFDHPTLGVTRQNVICQVFQDISDFLITPSNTPRVLIKIPTSGLYTGIGSLAGQGSSYYTTVTDITGGMVDGNVWKTINSGFDSWGNFPTNAILPLFTPPNTSSGQLFHGFLQLFFNDPSPTPLYHYDLSTSNSNPLLFDFYSLVLHEAMHVLGFASLIDFDGQSRMRSQASGAIPGSDACYTRYDAFLESTNTGSPSPLIDDTNPLNPAITLTGPNVIAQLEPGCTNALYNPMEYRGFNNSSTPQVVYSPNTYAAGSSFSHFSCDCPTCSGYSGAMLGCLQGGTNGVQRFPNQAEVNVLCDLGYSRQNTWTIAGTQVATYSSCTNPCYIVGQNDTETPLGVEYMTDNLTPITIHNVLDNDLPATATKQIQDGRIEVISGGGNISPSGNDFIYTPSSTFTGWAILAYIPECPSSIMYGNITYIFIRVFAPLPPCNDFDCNLICTGNLEEDQIASYRDETTFDGWNFNSTTFYTIDNLGGGQIDVPPFGTFPMPPIINGIIPVTATASTGCSTIDIDGMAPSLYPSNQTFVRLSTSSVSSVGQRGGIRLPLSKPLNTSQNYTFSFWAIPDMGCTDLPEVYVFGTNSPRLPICPSSISLPTSIGAISTHPCGGSIQLLGTSTPITPVGTPREWTQYSISINNANISNAYDFIYIALQTAPTSALLDEFELYCNNSTQLTITASTPTPYPCVDNIGNLDPITVEYEVCLDAFPNTDDIALEVDLDAFSVAGGNFNTLGQLTIPSGTQTTQCATYSITLNSPTTPNSIQAGVPLNFDIALTSLGTSCIDATTTISVVDIVPIGSSPLTITKSVSPGPHLINQPLTYSIEVCNVLPTPVNNIVVSDQINPSELTFVSANSPNFPNNSGSLTISTNTFDLPAVNSPDIPVCTTFTFEAQPIIGTALCAPSSIIISNSATADISGSQCPVATSNTVDIFPSAGNHIPASVTTLSQAISQGYLEDRATASYTPQTVTVEGTLTMDLGINNINYNYRFVSSEIIMMPGAEIIIPADQRVSFSGSHIHNCPGGEMWKRILVQTGGNIGVYKGSLIEHGEHAIQLEDKSLYSIIDCRFNDNYISLYAAPSSNPKNISGAIIRAIFEGSGAMPPAHSFTNTALYPLAGIEFHDVINLNIVQSQSNNIFRGLAHGIRAFNTHLSVQSSIFEHLQTVPSYGWFTNTGIWAQSSTSHSLQQTGFGNTLSSQPSFLDCKYGIFILGGYKYFINKNLIQLSTTEPNPIGIVCALAKGKSGDISDNRIESTQAGIYMYQVDDPNTFLKIQNNHISLSDQSFMGGIALQEGGVAYSPEIKNNIIELAEAQNGIEMTDQNGALVEGNTINLLNSPTFDPTFGLVGYPNRTGIFTKHGQNQDINCNIVQGGPSSSNSPIPDVAAYNLSPIGYNNQNSRVFGIKAWMSPNNSYFCNAFDMIPNGILIRGTPSSCEIKGSRFDRVARGIWLASGAQIGQQFHFGNRWVWAPGGNMLQEPDWLLDAIGVGVQNDAPSLNSLPTLASLFEYDNSLTGNTNFLPFRIIAVFPNQWFQLGLSSNNSFDCNNTNTCSPPVPFALVNPNLSTVEQAVVSGTFQSTTFPQTADFEANSATYSKLKTNPSLAPTGSLEASFVSNLDQQCEGHFYAIGEQCETLNSIPTATQNQLDVQEIQIDLDLKELYRLDSLWVVDSVHRDSIRILAFNKGQLLQPILQQNKQIWTTVQQNRNTLANTTKSDNDNIHVNKKAEKNLKKVNKIYLETIAKGIFNFSQSQRQKLHHIALKCPLEDGVAVYKARSMISFFTNVNYEDLQDCTPKGKNKKAREYTGNLSVFQNVKLYPNPATNQITLEWQLGEVATNRELLIYNALGQKIYNSKVPGVLSNINSTEWAAGLYLCKLYENKVLIRTEKIIIIKP